MNEDFVCADPKERLREERDGIILSPQRKSFVTGCHVTTGQPQVTQTRRSGSPTDHRDNDRCVTSLSVHLIGDSRFHPW